MTDPGFETTPDGGPRTAAEIRQQLTELAEVKDAAAACGRDDFATGVVLASLREHELDLLEELRAAEVLASSADAEFSLGGEPVQGNEVPASLLGEFLCVVQNLTYSVAQVLAGQPTSRARIQRSLAAENKLLVLPQFVLSSFGFRVRLPTKEELGQFPDVSLVTSDALTRVCDMLGEQEPAVDLLAYPRVKSHYRRLMELLGSQNMEVRVRSRSNPRGAQVTSRKARERVEWLDLLQTTTETVEKEGVLVGGSIEKRRFELKVDDGLYTGDVSERAREQMQALRWGATVSAELKATTKEHEEGAGGPVVEYVAESFTPAGADATNTLPT